jgi:O-antigen ligase
MKYKTTPRKKESVNWMRIPMLLAAVLLFCLPTVISFVGLDKFRLTKEVFVTVMVLLLTLTILVFLKRLPYRISLWSWEALLLLATAYTGLHSLVSPSRGTSFYAFCYFSLFVLLFFVLRAISSPGSLQWTWLVLGTASALNSLLAVLQYFGMVSAMVTDTGEVLSGRIGAVGFIGDVNSAGFLFGLVSLALFAFVFGPSSRGIRAFASALLLINLVGLLFTQTLTAILSLVFCLVLWFAFHHWWVLRNTRKFTRGLILLWIVLGLGLAGGLVLGQRTGTLDRIQGVWNRLKEGDWMMVTSGRQPVYWLTWQMIKQEPLLGSGLNMFSKEFFFFRADTEIGRSVDLLEQTGAYREVHNEYLQIWYELGILGLLAFCVLLISPAVIVLIRIQQMGDGRAAYWAGILSVTTIQIALSCLAFFPFHLAVTLVPIVLVFASLRHVTDLPQGRVSGIDLRAWSPRLRMSMYGLSALVILFLCYGQIQKWRANNEAGVAAFLLERASSGQYEPRQSRVFADQALARLEYAETICSRLPVIRSLKGTALMLLGRYDTAIENYSDAAQQIPSPEAYVNLASAYMAKNQNERAEECVQRALRYEPRFGKALHALDYLKGQQK